jgi:ATP-dependent Lhr-like helicase
VLLGANPAAALTRRAKERLTVIRSDSTEIVHPGGTVIVRAADGDVRWWTFAGHNANATLSSTLAELAADPIQRHTDFHVRLRSDVTPTMWTEARSDATERICLPDIDPRAVAGLKFGAALPERLATATLAARLAAPESARLVLAEPTRWLHRSADC